jgi:hypothetical protein
LDGAARAAVVRAAAKQLRDGYVFPEVGEQAAKTLESALAAGSYDALNDPVAFAERVTSDLSAVAHDKHLRVVAGGLAQMPPGAAAPPRSEAGVARADRLAGNIGYIEIVSFPPVDVLSRRWIARWQRSRRQERSSSTRAVTPAACPTPLTIW